MTNVECPLCRIRIDTDYDYEIKYLWCDDCRLKVTRYLIGKKVSII